MDETPKSSRHDIASIDRKTTTDCRFSLGDNIYINCLIILITANKLFFMSDNRYSPHTDNTAHLVTVCDPLLSIIPYHYIIIRQSK